ncbi:MAG: hypothetical protein HRU75_09520 [Planctomycetia bacterium]|nr:MAG: hypothetical protein HRU75_09520 [Planctomycetia bacterium]
MKRVFSVSAIALASIFARSAVGGVLLIPNTGTGFDNVWAFDSFDGSLVDNNYIAGDANMQQVIKVVRNGSGNYYMVDETADAVFEYGANRLYIQTLANSSGNGLDQPYSIALHNNQLYVSVVGGLSPNTVQRFELDGSGQTTFADFALLGAGTPRDILFRANDVLIGDSVGDDIERFDLSGGFLSIWHDSDGATGIDFPNQLYADANGDILAAGFTAPFGIYRYDANGAQLNYWTLPTSPRGVHRLGNGRILWSGGTRVGVLDPATGTSADVLNTPNASFRFITLVADDCLRGDANCDGAVNNFDIDPFVAAILDPASPTPPPGYSGNADCWALRLCWGDVSGDDLLNNFDIDPFVACILGSPLPGEGCP